MSDDIISSHLLEGKRKSELIELLGHPDSKRSEEDWTYSLGTSTKGLGWQINFLEINFKDDKVDKVITSEIVD